MSAGETVSEPPWEIAMLLRGLQMAYDRCASAHGDDPMPDPVRAVVSAWEFVGWACALDEWLANTTSGYRARRDPDPDGRLLLGLRFARDRGVHQAGVVAAPSFTMRWREDAEGNVTAGPVLDPPVFAWRHLIDVTEPNNGYETKKSYRQRRSEYETHLADQPALPILARAQQFLTDELRASGMEHAAEDRD